MKNFTYGVLFGFLVIILVNCAFLEEQWDDNKVRVYDQVIELLEEEKEEGRTLEQVIEELRELRDNAIAEVDSATETQ